MNNIQKNINFETRCNAIAEVFLQKGLLANYSLGNNGWPLFLSLFFSTFQFDNVQNYMQLQQIITILIFGITLVM